MGNLNTKNNNNKNLWKVNIIYKKDDSLMNCGEKRHGKERKDKEGKCIHILFNQYTQPF